MRYDLNSNFRMLLEKAGHVVLSTRSAWDEVAAPPTLKKRIELTSEERFIRFNQTFSADGTIAILSVVHINKNHLLKYPQEGVYEDNIDSFFQSHCTMGSEYVISWPIAKLDEKIAMSFGLEPNVPVLAWEEVYYNILDECMGLIEVYFNPTIMDLSMLLHF
jgi:DNA-binding GntR family transcriptional regulator